ncbi:MAG: O-antigen ligase family protein [Planctomycetaceae bacterium]|nr:O-antigen ligase family protein [Planctomycetaceae bacterium]
MIWILVGYMWLVLHRPFEIWPIFESVRLLRFYMIFTLIAWFLISAKTWTSNRNNAALFFVAFSVFVSTLLSPYAGLGDNQTTESWFKVFVFFLLIMTSVKTEKDLKILVTAFAVCFTLYMLHSYRRYLSGGGAYSMGTWRMTAVNSSRGRFGGPNEFGNAINYAMCLLLPLMALAKEMKSKIQKRLIYLFFIGSFGLSIICIQLTGSRASFAGLGISLFGLAMLSKHRIRLLLAFAIACPLIWFSLTDNLQNRFRTLWDPSAGPANAQASAEGRKEFFWIGLEIWKQYPVFGVGPNGFQQASGTDMQPHGLIPQVLSELGTLGAIAYLTLVGAILSNHLKAHLLYKKMKVLKREGEVLYLYRISFGVTWAVFLLFFLGFGCHNAFWYTWVWYGAFQAIAVEFLRQKVNVAFSTHQPFFTQYQVQTTRQF